MFGTLGLPYHIAMRCLWQLMKLSTPKCAKLPCSQIELVIRSGKFLGLKGIHLGSSLDHVAVGHGGLRPISAHLSQFWCCFGPMCPNKVNHRTLCEIIKEVGILFIYIYVSVYVYVYANEYRGFKKVYMWILIQAFIFAVIPWSTIRISGTPRVRATSHTASAMVMIFFSDPTKHTKVRSSVTCQGMFVVCEACWSSRVRATSTDPQQLCWILLGLNIFETTGPELISA